MTITQGEGEDLVMAGEYRCPYCCREHDRRRGCVGYGQVPRERWGVHVLDWRWLVGREEASDAAAVPYADVVPGGSQEDSIEEWNAKVDAMLAEVRQWHAETVWLVKEPVVGAEEEWGVRGDTGNNP